MSFVGSKKCATKNLNGDTIIIMGNDHYVWTEQEADDHNLRTPGYLGTIKFEVTIKRHLEVDASEVRVVKGPPHQSMLRFQPAWIRIHGGRMLPPACLGEFNVSRDPGGFR